jgi:vacuole morphology and inheritance protein 14
LQLLAQISSSSEDSYFRSFMVNVLELFSTDRRLLETRGSLIIRQLCLHLNAEKIFRTLADIQDLEFASMMVIKLNMILITSPELSDFRRRLKNLESKDGQMLFTSLYRSWCHNAVAAFALCLLAQAYEHASNVLQILWVKHAVLSDHQCRARAHCPAPRPDRQARHAHRESGLHELVEGSGPSLTPDLRLQLLEPDKYPYLPKCLYGLLMILPQSSAFVSLRARLAVVNSSGYAPPPARAGYAPPVRKSGRDEIKWSELLSRKFPPCASNSHARLPIRASPARARPSTASSRGPEREHALLLAIPDFRDRHARQAFSPRPSGPPAAQARLRLELGRQAR